MSIEKLTKSVLLKNGRVYDPVTGESMPKTSILIKGGVITGMGDLELKTDGKIVDCTNKVITTGFTDIHAHFREPGREDKETLETGAQAAIAGGYTRVCVMPNTNPVLDSPESIRFILEKSEGLPVVIHPIGAITMGQKGESIAEVGEMVKSGAVAISDDGLPVTNGQIMRYALEYSEMYNIPVINHAEDVHIRADGLMNEGTLSTRLGMPGNPDVSESVMVYRDLALAEYTGGRLHVPHVSTAKSVDLIRKFKKKGLPVSAEVTPHHIGLTEDRLRNFDTNAKVAPPLRLDADRQALIEGLKDGTIDCIATDHAPHTIEDKERDMHHAPSGMIGLESAFALSWTILRDHGIKLERLIDWLTKNPSGLLNLPIKEIAKGEPANLTIIDENESWIFERDDIYSKSRNSPMIGMTFTGRVVAVVSGEFLFQK